MAKKPDPNRIITLEVVHDPVRAQVIKDVLAQEGIEAILPGLGSGGGVMVGAAAGALDIPVKVRAADAEAAREIIDAMEDFDAVLPDGEEGPAVPAEEMQRRLERLGAEEEGEGPYREAPVGSSERPDSPRVMRIALPAAIIIPFGGAHLYARDYRTGGLLALTQVIMLAIVFGGEAAAWWGFMGVVAADMIGAPSAVERFNEGRSPSTLRDYLATLVAIAVAALVVTPWALRSAMPIWYLESEVETLCDELADRRPRCRSELEEALMSGAVTPMAVDHCARCLDRAREARDGSERECGYECSVAVPREWLGR